MLVGMGSKELGAEKEEAIRSSRLNLTWIV
jgi:hypothetical protein